LQSIGVSHIDLAVVSHAHADHIGGFPAVFGALSVGEIWYNGQTHTTRTFERFIDTLIASPVVYHEPRRGDTRMFGDLAVSSLHPRGSAQDYSGNLHDQNIIIRADFGAFAILLPGDAEQYAEYEVLGAGVPLGATALVLGHHGSRTSSSERFLRAVQPEVVFYQAGTDNRYGHPHREIIRRVQRLTGAPIYGSDTHGTIILHATARGLWSVTTTTAR
jgi:competence protein ComEC